MKVKKRTLMIVLGVIIALIAVYTAYAVFVGGNGASAAANLPAMVGGC